MTVRFPALALAVVLTLASTAASSTAMSGSISKSFYGRLPDGTAVDQYTLTNADGGVLKVITYGAIITELRVPDRNGKMGDVVLGFDRLESYVTRSPYFGAAIGRVGNRIAKGTFSLDGKTYHLAINNGPNALHGGLKGFDKVAWKATPKTAKDGSPSIEFHYVSKDGEEGYPGTLRVDITYTWATHSAGSGPVAPNMLRIDYRATTDKDTPVNLTNHSYWNLSGHGDILGEILTLNASHCTPTDDTLIPTGAIDPVAGTPFDFTQPKEMGRDLKQLTSKPQGYDVNFVLDGRSAAPTAGGPEPGAAPEPVERVEWAARVYDPESGRVMEVATDQPGIQFYTGNFLDGTLTGKHGQVYEQHDAFCLETQHFPDSVNHPNFPSTILHPGEAYHTVTTYRFSAR